MSWTEPSPSASDEDFLRSHTAPSRGQLHPALEAGMTFNLERLVTNPSEPPAPPGDEHFHEAPTTGDEERPNGWPGATMDYLLHGAGENPHNVRRNIPGELYMIDEDEEPSSYAGSPSINTSQMYRATFPPPWPDDSSFNLHTINQGVPDHDGRDFGNGPNGQFSDPSTSINQHQPPPDPLASFNVPYSSLYHPGPDVIRMTEKPPESFEFANYSVPRVDAETWLQLVWGNTSFQPIQYGDRSPVFYDPNRTYISVVAGHENNHRHLLSSTIEMFGQVLQTPRRHPRRVQDSSPSGPSRNPVHGLRASELDSITLRREPHALSSAVAQHGPLSTSDGFGGVISRPHPVDTNPPPILQPRRARATRRHATPCDECSMLFSSPKALKAHKKNVHVERNFHCRRPGCQRSFKDSRSRGRHEASHDGHSDTATICPYCDTLVRRPDNQLRHDRTCKGRIPCPFCDQMMGPIDRHDNCPLRPPG
ncbi:hypothetical protein EJ06DRAFT_180684 [Trichodelitschia bisporula]|uniref:C2H2-type domain-containing protein n=1 Tax=Trichodelitschia bisporula TaxID=703511 RepID=A0A6G1HMH1_9PEZI|nr:hypothetical protein EJ06DRAFT_180684 [Trichodelitschia bisporula]